MWKSNTDKKKICFGESSDPDFPKRLELTSPNLCFVKTICQGWTSFLSSLCRWWRLQRSSCRKLSPSVSRLFHETESFQQYQVFCSIHLVLALQCYWAFAIVGAAMLWTGPANWSGLRIMSFYLTPTLLPRTSSKENATL